jgi:carbon-monoxide dehydrogenase medium subunit
VSAALHHVGHRQTRNRGTIGGSLAHLDPSAELANLAALHEATLVLEATRGKRTLPFAEFAQGYLTTALAEDELLTDIAFNAWPDGHGYAFEEVARRHGDFAIAAVSALITLDAHDRIERAAICVSGVTPVPTRLSAAERALSGEHGSHEVYRAAAIEAEKLDAMSDAFISSSYRQHLARVLTYRVLQRAVERARKRSHHHV